LAYGAGGRVYREPVFKFQLLLQFMLKSAVFYPGRDQNDSTIFVNLIFELFSGVGPGFRRRKID
jgi:hypothetical protein